MLRYSMLGKAGWLRLTTNPTLHPREFFFYLALFAVDSFIDPFDTSKPSENPKIIPVAP